MSAFLEQTLVDTGDAHHGGSSPVRIDTDRDLACEHQGDDAALLRRVPFEGQTMTELRERVIAGKVKPITPGTYSPELVGLMYGLLTLTPARRPTLTAILTMPQVYSIWPWT